MVGWAEFVCAQVGRVWVGKVDESVSICVWPRWTGGKADGRVQLGKGVWASRCVDLAASAHISPASAQVPGRSQIAWSGSPSWIHAEFVWSEGLLGIHDMGLFAILYV